jgi:hypothetical protein
MKADLGDKLQKALRGGIAPKTGVTGVTGVAEVSATCPKSLNLQQLRQLRIKTDKLANDVIRGVAGDVASPHEPEEAEIKELKGMTMYSVPERYLDAWARFQLQCPGTVTEQAWRQAIDDAGRFLAQWGKLADSFGWTPGGSIRCAARWRHGSCLVVERQDRSGLSLRPSSIPPTTARRGGIGSTPTRGRSGRSPCRLSWSISKGSCNGFDERLHSPFQRACSPP